MDNGYSIAQWEWGEVGLAVTSPPSCHMVILLGVHGGRSYSEHEVVVVYHDSSLPVQLNKSLTSFGTSSFKTWTPMLLFWTSYITTSLLKVTRRHSQWLWIELNKTSFYICTWGSVQKMPSAVSVTSSLMWRATQKWVLWGLPWNRVYRKVIVYMCACIHACVCLCTHL